MTREEKEQTGKYVLQMARLLEDGCYQQEMLLKAVHIIDEALKQEPTTKNDLGVDCISRVEVIDYLCKHCPDDGECFKDCDEIKHIRQMPSVTPQEPVKKLEEQIKQLQNRCHALTHGQICVFCPYECEHKAEVEPQESEDI